MKLITTYNSYWEKSDKWSLVETQKINKKLVTKQYKDCMRIKKNNFAKNKRELKNVHSVLWVSRSNLRYCHLIRKTIITILLVIFENVQFIVLNLLIVEGRGSERDGFHDNGLRKLIKSFKVITKYGEPFDNRYFWGMGGGSEGGF